MDEDTKVSQTAAIEQRHRHKAETESQLFTLVSPPNLHHQSMLRGKKTLSGQ